MAKLITRIARELIDENLIEQHSFGDYGSAHYGVLYASESVSAIVQAKVRTLKPATRGIIAHQATVGDVFQALPDWFRRGSVTGRLTLELLTEAVLLMEVFRLVDEEVTAELMELSTILDRARARHGL